MTNRQTNKHSEKEVKIISPRALDGKKGAAMSSTYSRSRHSQSRRRLQARSSCRALHGARIQSHRQNTSAVVSRLLACLRVRPSSRVQGRLLAQTRSNNGGKQDILQRKTRRGICDDGEENARGKIPEFRQSRAAHDPPWFSPNVCRLMFLFFSNLRV